MQLDADTLHAAGGKLHTELTQLVPVVVIQNAAALSRVRNNMVVDAKEEQVFHGVAVVAGDLADGDLIQRDGDGAHAVLGQDLTEQPGEGLQVHGLVAQDLHKLVQHTAEDIPKLGGLLRRLQPPRLRLGLHLCLQGGAEAQTLQKRVK